MKTVKFTEDTKQHDGLSPNLRLFDEVVHDFFNCPKNRYKTLNSLKKPINEDILANLSKNLLNLAERCTNQPTPVVACGGGRNNIVGPQFKKWLVKLAGYVEKMNI